MRAVDLFAGCGGLSKGFEDAGFELTLAIEAWQAARSVYEANFDHPVVDLDLSDIAEAVPRVALERPDLVMGGPPCQEFSPAGRRQEGHRAELTVNFAEIVSCVQPDWFVLENVQGIVGSDAWADARSILQNAGYGITESVLNAAFYDVPQFRKRFFAVGRLGAPDGFLQEELDVGRSDLPKSVREHVGEEFGIEYYYRHPRTWGRKGVFSIDEPSPTVRSTNRKVPPGYKAHPGDAGPHQTARPLTSAERARIQTFAPSFSFDGFETHRDMMIANAVPVNLAKHVAGAIRRYEEDKAVPEDQRFKQWLSDTHAYGGRAAGNVVSRVNRAWRLLGEGDLSLDSMDVIHALERKPEYQVLGSAVKSQIKRALRLRSEYYQQITGRKR